VQEITAGILAPASLAPTKAVQNSSTTAKMSSTKNNSSNEVEAEEDSTTANLLSRLQAL
jgi:hypothetical protein